MMRIARLAFFLLTLAGSTALAGQPAADAHRYAVELKPDALAGAPDVRSLAQELAATYGAAIESLPAAAGEPLVLTLLPSRAQLLSNDPRVRTATEISPSRSRIAPTDTCTTCWNYSYDPAGNITAAGADTYRYDTVNRLVTATAGGAANGVTYQYDSFGNRTAATPATGAAKCVGGTDCDMAVTVNHSTNRLSMAGVAYDPAGNLTQLDASNSFTFDALSMAQSAHLGSTTLQYVYTADDERVAVYDGGLWTWTLRDLGARPLSEYTSANSTSGGTTSYGSANLTRSRDYIWRGSALLASEARKSYSDSTVVTERFHLDHLGTPRLVTDDNGNKLGLHTFYPFGGELDLLPYEQPEAGLKFTGHTRDTGRNGGISLDDMHARYYSASFSRFFSVDPTWSSADRGTPQSWNRYSYVINNPLTRTDPDGRCFWDLCAGEALAAHAAGLALTAATIYVLTPSLVVPHKTNGQVMVSQAVDGLQAAATWLASGNTGSGGDSPALDRHVENVSKQLMKNESASPDPAPGGSGDDGSQDKVLSRKEVSRLEKHTGEDVHDIKKEATGDKNVSKYDLYKDKAGNIYVKPKGSSERGEFIGYNINDFTKK